MTLRRSIADIIVPEDSPTGLEYRKRVELLMLWRLVVTSLLLGATILLQLRGSESFFVESVTPLYVLIGATFLLSLLYAVSLPQILNLRTFSFFQIVVDIAYYTALVYFTGGVSSAFSPIYIFPIIAAGILHYRGGALAAASLASVLFGLLLALDLYNVIPKSNWPWVVSWASESPGYVLWVIVVHFTVFFLVAFLASSVTEQLQKTRVSLKLTETDLRKLSDLHSSIVRSIPSGIMTTDESDRITFVNEAGTRILDSSLRGLVSTPIADVLPVITDLKSHTAHGSGTFGTVQEINGDKAQLELTVSDLRDQGGSPSGRLVIFQDVTYLKEMEERVKRSERQAALARIAAGMAHEIRNPLSALRGAAELLSQFPPGTVDHQKLLGIILRESDRLNSLLENFLITVIPRSKRQARVMLEAIVEQSIELFSKEPTVTGKVSLETLVDRGVEVEGDPPKLKRAFWNLLSNAAEASPEGGVIQVRLRADRASHQAILSVRDFGAGLPAEIKDRIFEPLVSSKEGRAGMGLAIVLSVIEAHDGAIEVDSDLETGTVFTMRLPLASRDSSFGKGAGGNA